MTNTGKVAGREVVQVYVAYPDAKVERCVKDLRGFAKTKLLAPGESETVRIPIAIRDLAYFDELDHRFVTDEGVYELLVGTSSRNILRKKTVAVGETFVNMPLTYFSYNGVVQSGKTRRKE